MRNRIKATWKREAKRERERVAVEQCGHLCCQEKPENLLMEIIIERVFESVTLVLVEKVLNFPQFTRSTASRPSHSFTTSLNFATIILLALVCVSFY